jgi:hypothetical protein
MIRSIIYTQFWTLPLPHRNKLPFLLGDYYLLGILSQSGTKQIRIFRGLH